MINVNLSSNAGTTREIVGADTTLRQLFEAQGINYSNRQVFVDGCPIRVGDLDRTFEELGILASCTVSAIDAKNNAKS